MSEKLDKAINQIEKLFGKGSLMYISDDQIVDCEVISTGSIAVNQALTIGGIPRGRITEIYGPESSGKTTLSLHVIAEAQKKGLQCAFIDAEHALDIQYAQALGVDVNKLLLSQPDHGEQALEILDILTETGELGCIVIDSVAALTPKAEIEGDYGDSQMGLQARLMSQAMRKLTAKVQRSKTAVIFINQLRDKIGVMFGSPETTTGGKALKFYASIRIDIRRIAAVKESEENVANRTKVKIAKNKLASPFKVCEFEIRFGEGIDQIKEIIEFGIEYGLIEKSGAWYTIGEDRIQGVAGVRKVLSENEDMKNDLLSQLTGGGEVDEFS